MPPPPAAPAAAPPAFSAQQLWPAEEAPESEFTLLVTDDGLTGWLPVGTGQFSAKQGLISVAGDQGQLRTKNTYTDFELRTEFRFLAPGADSGIFFRLSETLKYQLQTKDADDLGEIRSGEVSQIHLRELTAKTRKPPGEWQTFDLLVQGGNCWAKLNGEQVTWANGLTEQEGVLALQAEGSAVEFRNLRVRKLK